MKTISAIGIAALALSSLGACASCSPPPPPQEDAGLRSSSTGDIMPAVTVTAVSTSLDTLTATAHGLLTGDRFRLRNVGGALPAATPALAGVTDYFAVRVDANNIKAATSSANALAGTPVVVDITGAGSGTTTIEYGLPYTIPNAVYVNGVSQIQDKDLNTTFNALVAFYDLLTGQPQSVIDSPTFAGNLTVGGAASVSGLLTANAGLTAGANQHVTVSGTGLLKHGTVTLQIPITTTGTTAPPSSVSFNSAGGGVFVAPIPLPLGKRILRVRAFITDSATGPTKLVVGLRQLDNVGGSSLNNAGSQSAGSGALQTINSAAMTVTVTTQIRNYAEAQIQTGTANCTIQGFEVDYDQP